MSHKCHFLVLCLDIELLVTSGRSLKFAHIVKLSFCLFSVTAKLVLLYNLLQLILCFDLIVINSDH